MFEMELEAIVRLSEGPQHGPGSLGRELGGGLVTKKDAESWRVAGANPRWVCCLARSGFLRAV